MARTFTPEELLAYDGSDSSKPVYIAVKGVVYDVSASREFYGKGGPYEAFAGRECSRALAIMKVDAAECNGNLADCTEKQLKTLEDWIAKFNTKYTVVGKAGEGGPAAEAAGAKPAPSGRWQDEKVDLDEIRKAMLRQSPFTPELLATLIIVGLLTALAGYILYIDMTGQQPLEPHTEL
ncbi:hypothetical protein HYH02_011527 [Chlamydomonas schloesseri]|uniref:Cytochrome b5 heme-binding domain-containing protein n=1 Tax=Chlamydomonas schloesseri TaxID=2026947 RepID=A0A835TD21_9CHLO|nr:hypothetical protein HYH02_011527 [Chlamydomonas schloesseri]|eukprot:KAG2436590.1 hypothetical protein HYH02_011527 [Chlamydomonas schloesseri]